MNIRRKLERLERRVRDALCTMCKNRGGGRFVYAWPGEPLDLAVETACPSCGRCPPQEQVKVTDLTGVLDLDFNPYELAVAKSRITGKITEAELEELNLLEEQYAAISTLKRGAA